MIDTYGGSRSTKNRPTPVATAEESNSWFNYMSRFSRYVNNEVKDNEQRKIVQQPKQGQSTGMTGMRKSPSNLNMPRRPLTLLESQPLQKGLGLRQRNNIDVAASCTSSQRDQMEMMQHQLGMSQGMPTTAADTVTFLGGSHSSSVIAGSPNRGDRRSSDTTVRKTRTLSNCNCQLDSYDGQFLLCRYAKQWLESIEEKTDLQVNYQQSAALYERVQRRQRNVGDERQISLDIPRTFPEEPFFSS